jgi:hypothetical protein
MNSQPEAYSQSFFDVIRNSGSIGIIIWSIIFIFFVIGPVLGIFSIICCSKTKSKQIPLSFKLLIISAICLFLSGLYGALTGAIDTFCGFATIGSVDQAQILSLSSSQALYSFAFGVQGSFLYLFFITISLIVLHFQQKGL